MYTYEYYIITDSLKYTYSFGRMRKKEGNKELFSWSQKMT